jgi:transporter family protein
LKPEKPGAKTWDRIGQSETMNWIYWSLLSAIFAGATAILAKVGVSGVDSNLATAIRTSVVLIFSWVIASVTSPSGAVHNLTSRTWAFLILSGLATGLSWLCYFRALQLGEASRVAPVDKLSVAFVILFAAMFLGERLTLVRSAGGLLIVAGAIILALE